AAAADHVVRPGENLSSIARRYGVSVAELTQLNRLANPNHLLVGTRLHLPETSDAAASSATARTKRTPRGTAPAGRAPAFTLAEPQRSQIAGLLEQAAEEFAVPMDLLKALTYTESRWRQDAISRTGAIGVGQLLPDTASWLAAMMREPGLDLQSPADNIRMSARLLRYLLDATGSTRKALAAYYQGIGAVLRTGVSTGGARYATVITSRRPWFA
ncbi:MAG TPA: LysM peptidoglycan-binding domain-containing protein, partial [Acidimicrobiales bacterium]